LLARQATQPPDSMEAFFDRAAKVVEAAQVSTAPPH